MDYLSQATNIVDATKDLSQEEKIDLVIQTAQALAYLHHRGILHQAIKPTNLLVSNGRVHLSDFGLSATEQQRSTISDSTPLYIAPEVYHQTQDYSIHSDLYSLGIIMYQLLAGTHPFNTLTPETAHSPIGADYEIASLNLSANLE